ncbi:MAG TPA: hypothetical protein VFZ65_18790 [Planctomycetota bacterium]|nr:hypothetical protein [Planctomycetota bacterium]
MRRWLTYCSLLAAVALLAFFVVETRRLAELAGRFEADARQARREAAQARAAADAADAAAAARAAEPAPAEDAGTIARLEAEVAASQAQLQAMSDTLKARAEEMERAAEAAKQRAKKSLAPMPEGVRTCLRTLQGCLRIEGFAGDRFLSARLLDDEGLHEVEMLHSHADGLGTTFVHAARMVAELDRGTGRFVLRFFEGQRSTDGELTPLPEEGWPIVFEPVDGRLFEERLPFLVRAVGAYAPEPTPGHQRAKTDVDASTQRQWLDRFDQLLAQAGTKELLRVTRFRGMQDGCFLTVELVGTDKMFRVLSTAYCAQLGVEVDRQAGVVSLLLKDGVLHRGGVESTITGEGYRMLLPDVTPKQATDAMFGMVVTK